jgi:hypothetical protein
VVCQVVGHHVPHSLQGHHAVLLHLPLDGLNPRLRVLPHSNHLGDVLINSRVNFLVMIIIVCVLMYVVHIFLACNRLRLGYGYVGREIIIVMGDGEVVECILDRGPVDGWFDPHVDSLIIL